MFLGFSTVERAPHLHGELYVLIGTTGGDHKGVLVTDQLTYLGEAQWTVEQFLQQ